MTSELSWLHTLREDQQRMRELLKLFSDTESRDELGIGQVRDTFGDPLFLFPGTSVLQNPVDRALVPPGGAKSVGCAVTASLRGSTATVWRRLGVGVGSAG